MQISGLSASNTFSATDVIAIEVNENGTNKTYKLTGATLATALASIGSYLKTTDVVDNLTSTDPTKVLGAPQGKALKDLIEQSTAKTSFNFSLPDGYSWNYFNGYMIANVYVYMAGRIDLASPSTAKTINLGTIIPQSCRPSSNVTFAAFNNVTDKAIDGRINTDGAFVFYRPETENLSAITFSVMYVI